MTTSQPTRKVGRPVTQPRLFVSYAREDAATVGIMVDVMRVGGPPIFRDVDSLSPGDEWQPKIETAISECDVFVIFWCRHAQASDAVRTEWLQALREGKRIVPILLDSTELPERLGRFQWIDCRPLIAETPHAPKEHRRYVSRLVEPTHLAGVQARKELFAILGDSRSGLTESYQTRPT